MSIALALHVIASIIWVGGMFLAFVVVRPAAVEILQPPERLALWVGIFKRFFPWVWLAIIALLITGYWMIFGPYGGMKHAPMFVHVMQTLGLVMMAIFGHVYFALFKRLQKAVDAKAWSEGATTLSKIRIMIGVNLALGITTVLVATMGKYYS